MHNAAPTAGLIRRTPKIQAAVSIYISKPASTKHRSFVKLMNLNLPCNISGAQNTVRSNLQQYIKSWKNAIFLLSIFRISDRKFDGIVADDITVPANLIQ